MYSIDKMRKKVIVTSIISLLAVLTPHAVLASTSVNIQNTVNGKSSDVKVESSDDNSSSIDLKQTNGETKIRLEQNGEVKTFETTGDEDINWNSEDGSAKVEVKSSESTNVTTQNSENKDSSVKITNDNKESSEEDDKKDNSEKNEEESFSFSSVVDSIRSFFSSLFS